MDIVGNGGIDEDPDTDGDGSIEGKIARSLFREDDDEEEEEEKEEEEEEICEHNDSPSLYEPAVLRRTTDDHDTSKRSESGNFTMITTKILHVRISSKASGGTIAERVWPAATHLAEFLLDVMRVTANAVPPSSETVSPDLRDKVAGMVNGLRHQPQRQLALSMVAALLLQSETPDSALSIVELGAGVGLTGLELASQLYCQVLLTDLPLGLPLLRRNVELNRDRFRLNQADESAAVTVQKLEWGNETDVLEASRWCEERASDRPVLIMGSDCVYWEELHEPLERTIFLLLSRCAPGSLCVLAGMRRWKRDNAFYQTLGKRTRTATQQLRCTCVQESISRSDNGQREVMRVFVVDITDRK
jgi:Lysine methyltransferase